MSGIEAQFIPGTSNKLLVVEYRAKPPVRGSIVHVPPFGEEMNKTRTMTSLQATRMADMGFRVLVPDLSGTGDSYGDFANATWDDWKEDIRAVLEVFEVTSEPDYWLWGVRLGVPLALDAMETVKTRPAGVIAWSPVQNGSIFLNQLFRMRTMASMLSGATKKESNSDLRSKLDSEGEIEIGGYTIGHALAASIEQLSLKDLALRAGIPLSWFEMIPDDDAVKSPVTLACAQELEAGNVCAILEWVTGPEFWNTVETSISAELIDGTCRAIARS
jgi:exosortase A-associated hydrolase 2